MVLVCLPVAIATPQSPIPRLIPLSSLEDGHQILTKDARGQDIYKVAVCGTDLVCDPIALGTRLSNANDVNPDDRFSVFGRAKDPRIIGIETEEIAVTYRHIPYSDRALPDPDEQSLVEDYEKRLPDLETFFEFGGTIELLTDADTPLERSDIVISEILWGLDAGVRDGTTRFNHDGDEADPSLRRNAAGELDPTAPASPPDNGRTTQYARDAMA